jgi:hypothetical protein
MKILWTRYLSQYARDSLCSICKILWTRYLSQYARVPYAAYVNQCLQELHIWAVIAAPTERLMFIHYKI